MRMVVVGSVVAVIGAAVGCRPAAAPAPADPVTSPPTAGPVANAPAAAGSASSERAEAQPPPPSASSPVREDGQTLFVKALGPLAEPRVAVGADGVVIAASGGCDDARPTHLGGSSDPGSFVVLVKMDTGGGNVWARTFLAPCGPKRTERASHATVAGVALDREGNIYLAGELTSASGPLDLGGGALASAGGSDIFVASFDASGRHRWSKRFGDASDQRTGALAVSPEGLVAVAGSLEGTADFGGGAVKAVKSDVLIVVLDSAGRHVASHAFGDASDQYGDLVAFGAKGELTLAGRYEGAIDFGGGPLPVSGKTASTFVAQYRDNGHGSSPRYAFAFSKALPGDVTLGALAGGGSDGTYLAGEFKGVADFGGGSLKAHAPDDKNAARADAFVAKLDLAGKHVFSKAFGLGGTHRIEGAALAGDLFIAGSFSGMTRFGDTMVSAGGDDALLVRLDVDTGEVRRAWRFGDTFSQDVLGLTPGGSPPSMHLLVRSMGTIDFGTGPQSDHGVLVVKMATGAKPDAADGGQ
jgi:hypothetical protein